MNVLSRGEATRVPAGHAGNITLSFSLSLKSALGLSDALPGKSIRPNAPSGAAGRTREWPQAEPEAEPEAKHEAEPEARAQGDRRRLRFPQAAPRAALRDGRRAGEGPRGRGGGEQRVPLLQGKKAAFVTTRRVYQVKHHSSRIYPFYFVCIVLFCSVIVCY